MRNARRRLHRLGLVAALGFAGPSAGLLLAGSASAQVPRPRLVAPEGHVRELKAVAVSPDGSLLLTAGWDRTARLWEVGTGMELRSFPVMANGDGAIAFSPDGRYVLTAGRATEPLGRDEARLWDAATGAELARFAHDGQVRAVAFTPDGSRVVTGGFDRKIRVWEPATGRLIREFASDLPVMALSVSPDGRMVAVGEYQSAVVRSLDTGEVRGSFRHGREVQAVAFSPRGGSVVSGGGLPVHWEVGTGEPLQHVACPNASMGVNSLAFSADGSRILSGDGTQACVVEAVYTRAPGGDPPYSRPSGVWQDLAHSVAFMPDGRIVTGNAAGSATLWDGSTPARTFTGRAAPLWAGVDTRAERLLTVGGTLRGPWSVQGEIDRFSNANQNMMVRVPTPDGRFVVTSGTGGLELRDGATGAVVRELPGDLHLHTNSITSAAVSSDGRLLMTGGSDQSAVLWDLPGARPLHQFGQSVAGSGFVFPVDVLAFSPDGTRVLTTQGLSRGAVTRVWDTRTFAAVFTVESAEAFTAGAFAPDGGQIAAWGEGSLRLVDAASGRVLKTFTSATRTSPAKAVRFSDDGTRIATAGQLGTAHLWDVASGREVVSLAGHRDQVLDIAFARDDAFVLTSGSDRTVRVFEARTGVEIAQLLQLTDGGWVVVTPDGRFDTDDLERTDGTGWVMPDDPLRAVPLAVFMRDFFEPGLLPRMLDGEDFGALRDLVSLNRAQPAVTIAEVGLEPGDSTAFVTLEVRSQTRSYPGPRPPDVSGMADLHLFRDGQIVALTPSLQPRNGSASVTHRGIKLPRQGGGSVEFSAYAFNDDRVKSETDRRSLALSTSIPRRRGRAYVVTVGVNEFSDPGWNLRYAADDARAMGSELESRLTATGDYEDVVWVPLVSDAPGYESTIATKEAVRAVFAILAGESTDMGPLAGIPAAAGLREANPEDLVVVSASTHGYTDREGTFYLLPQDIGPAGGRGGEGLSAALLSRAISSDELSQWFLGVDAGDLVMIVDACHSAAAVEGSGDFKPGPMGSRGLGQLAFNKGMRVLAASQAADFAFEFPELRQGLLTYALVEDGLRGEGADHAPRDGAMTLLEWLQYGVARVPDLWEEVVSGDFSARGVVTIGGTRDPLFQQPALFDFAKRDRAIPLGRTR
ncbi:MAG: hypothetical protein RJQ04_05780 [Longimicrobiales bacterium]